MIKFHGNQTIRFKTLADNPISRIIKLISQTIDFPKQELVLLTDEPSEEGYSVVDSNLHLSDFLIEDGDLITFFCTAKEEIQKFNRPIRSGLLSQFVEIGTKAQENQQIMRSIGFTNEQAVNNSLRAHNQNIFAATNEMSHHQNKKTQHHTEGGCIYPKTRCDC